MEGSRLINMGGGRYCTILKERRTCYAYNELMMALGDTLTSKHALSSRASASPFFSILFCYTHSDGGFVVRILTVCVFYLYFAIRV